MYTCGLEFSTIQITRSNGASKGRPLDCLKNVYYKKTVQWDKEINYPGGGKKKFVAKYKGKSGEREM